MGVIVITVVEWLVRSFDGVGDFLIVYVYWLMINFLNPIIQFFNLVYFHLSPSKSAHLKDPVLIWTLLDLNIAKEVE